MCRQLLRRAGAEHEHELREAETWFKKFQKRAAAVATHSSGESSTTEAGTTPGPSSHTSESGGAGGAGRASRRKSRARDEAPRFRTPMMEFGFENLPFAAVMERCQNTLATIDAMVNLLRTRASAEERYSKSLREVAYAGPSLMRSLLGSGPGKSDATDDHATLHAALEAAKDASHGEGERRSAFAAQLESTAARLADFRHLQERIVNSRASDGKRLMSMVRDASRRVARASERLDKARHAEAKAKGKRDRDSADPKVSERQRGKNAASVASAGQSVEEAEAEMRDCTNTLIMARQRRKDGMAAISAQLQRSEEDRLHVIADALRSLTDTEKTFLEAAAAGQQTMSAVMTAADPYFDMRLFVHAHRVDAMLVAQRQEAEASRRLRDGGDGGPGLEIDDEGDAYVPEMLPSSQQVVSSSVYMREAEELEPVVVRFLDAIFAGKATLVESTGDDDGEEDADAGDSDGSGEEEGADGNFNADRLFSKQAGRDLFLKHLNFQRAKKQDVGPGFDTLARAMAIFLDKCHFYHDVTGTKKMMIMSETFFREHPAGGEAKEGEDGVVRNAKGKLVRREFVQGLVKLHPIWRDSNCWEEMFYRSVREAVQKLHTPHSQARADGGEADGAGGMPGPDASSMPAPGSREWEYMYQQMVFGNLGSYMLNMRTFELPHEDVVRIVKRLGKGNGLPEDMLSVLFRNADGE